MKRKYSKVRKTGNKKKSVPGENSVPYHRKPANMNLEEWQIALRKQFARGANFTIKSAGEHPVFTDYSVYNPETRSVYKVALRSSEGVMNFCSCPDFKTNNLGTCKHIEAVIIKVRKKRGAAKIYESEYNRPYTSVYLKYGQDRSVKIRYGTENTNAFRKLGRQFFNEDNSLPEVQFDKFGKFIDKAAGISSSFRCYEDAMDFVIRKREDKKRRLLFSGKNLILEKILNTDLFPFQNEGIRFAARAGRSLIADDMGLGKTVQAIAVAELLRAKIGIERVLIVCPTSLKYQWKSEIEKFTGQNATVIQGMPSIRNAQYKADSFYKIISYNVVKADLPAINENCPDLVILDEAQRIKNWKTKTAQSVKKIQSRFVTVLTGTPIENKLEELYSIVQFIDPYKLGPLFKFLDEHQVKDESGKVTGYKNLNQIGSLLSDIMIRRKKSEVLTQLPERTDKVLFVPLTSQQADTHDYYKEIVAKLIAKWRNLGFLPEPDRQRLLIALNCMRMVCNSTYILDQETRHDTKIEELMAILDEVLESGDDKLVIFSQWERMTRLVAMELDLRGIPYENLHGGVPGEKRKTLFDNFNNKKSSRIFLSTDAGGLGLNLQSGNIVVNLDIPWNPAVLEQRIARVHRMGQKKNVQVINLVAAGTIEHRMLDVLKFKSSMARGVLDQGEDSIFMGESRFNAFMKNIEQIVDDPEQKEIPGTVSEGSEMKTSEFQQETITDEELIAPEDDRPEKSHVGKETHQGQSMDVSPASLITQGISFFERLAKTLSDKEATRQLADSLIENDRETGKTYLKIPVESRQTVENVFTLVGSLFESLKKGK